jgi:hypothetical protein
VGPGHDVTVASRFCGPPDSGNGGYVAGRLAGFLDTDDAVTVTLRRPPPLDRRLDAETVSRSARLVCDGEVVAQAEPGDFGRSAPAAVSIAEAVAAEPSYRGLADHPFPTCFVCGHGRADHDGLALMPGRWSTGRTACTWTPDTSLAAPDGSDATPGEFVWAALDCPGGWASDLEARPLVLGRITAQCSRLPRIGETYVVVGALHGTERRKTFTGSALYDAAGSLLARAEHVWIAVDPAQI